MTRFSRLAAAAGAAALIFGVAACSTTDDENAGPAGSPGAGGGDKDPVTLEWWHIQTGEVGSGIWQDLADEFTAANPHVTIDITVQDGAAFDPAINARIQAGDAPDIFQVWAGAGFETTVSTGVVQDVTAGAEGWIDGIGQGPADAFVLDGKRYAIPYNSGLVGFWYNKALFAEAGIDAPPETWTEFLDAIDALAASGVIPIAAAGFDKYPLMFYYEYLALRDGGYDAFASAVADGAFDDPMFIEAGNRIGELVEANPFQEGMIAAPFSEPGGSASLMANGKAGMELMGHWAPASMLTVAEDGVGLGEDLGWFPFPSLDGGSGVTTDAVGGVDGFAVGADAPAEALEFLEFISTKESALKVAAGGELLSPVVGAEEGVEDPAMQEIAAALGESTSVFNFLDQAVAPAVATALNDNVQQLFAQTMSAEEVAALLVQVASQQ